MMIIQKYLYFLSYKIKFKKNISIVRLKRVMGIIDEYVSINDEKYHLGP